MDVTKYFRWSNYIRSLGPQATAFMLFTGALFLVAVFAMRREWKK